MSGREYRRKTRNRKIPRGGFAVAAGKMTSGDETVGRIPSPEQSAKSIVAQRVQAFGKMTLPLRILIFDKSKFRFQELKFL